VRLETSLESILVWLAAHSRLLILQERMFVQRTIIHNIVASHDLLMTTRLSFSEVWNFRSRVLSLPGAKVP